MADEKHGIEENLSPIFEHLLLNDNNKQVLIVIQ